MVEPRASGEMVDTLVSGTSDRKVVEVQVLSRPPVIILMLFALMLVVCYDSAINRHREGIL